MGRTHSVTDAKLIDADQNGTISKRELAFYIARHDNLWSMLSIHLNLPEQKCREIATDVAYEFAKRKKKKGEWVNESYVASPPSDRQREPTVQEIQSFLDFVKEPKGEMEFFHRTVFRAFDQDENGYLDAQELDKFLDIFYQADSVFAGGVQLPSKRKLKAHVMSEFDVNGDGKLDFQEIRPFLSGEAQILAAN